MWVLDLLDDLNVVELDVEVLVDALECTADLDVILELDCHLVVDERLEETVLCSPLVLAPFRFSLAFSLFLILRPFVSHLYSPALRKYLSTC